MKELTLEITNHCVGFCNWCSSDSTVQYDGKTEMSYQKAYKLLDKYADKCSVVRISGGEPTSHPYLISIIKHAKIKGYCVNLLTNGHFIADTIEKDSNLIGEYVVNIISEKSIEAVCVLKYIKKNVSMHVVLVEGNEKNILMAVKTSLERKVPLRFLTLQKQGRAKFPQIKPLTLLSWTGDKGCGKDNKITVTWDGKVVTCSALKYKDTCDLECGK